MAMRAIALSLISITLVSACTSVRVDRVPPDVLRDMRRVCIERNPRVIVTDFLSVVQDGFRRHGIETAVYDPPLPGLPVRPKLHGEAGLGPSELPEVRGTHPARS